MQQSTCIRSQGGAPQAGGNADVGGTLTGPRIRRSGACPSRARDVCLVPSERALRVILVFIFCQTIHKRMTPLESSILCKQALQTLWRLQG